MYLSQFLSAGETFRLPWISPVSYSMYRQYVRTYASTLGALCSPQVCQVRVCAGAAIIVKLVFSLPRPMLCAGPWEQILHCQHRRHPSSHPSGQPQASPGTWTCFCSLSSLAKPPLGFRQLMQPWLVGGGGRVLLEAYERGAISTQDSRKPPELYYK
jgi:hypothetical protein